MSQKEPLSTEPYKGVRDFYPTEWAVLQEVFSTVRTLLVRNGFEEYNASPLERSELYESKTSEEIVSEQTYTFTDRGDRSVTLRPEMTPTLARMVAGKRRELVYPLRWFSIGNRFRYERPQKGRLREFYQIDVDIVGLSSGAAEEEVLVTADKILRSFGAQSSDYTIRVNSRVLLNVACEALGLASDEVRDYLSLLDRKNKISAEEFETARAPFRRDGTDALELIEAGTNEAVASEFRKLTTLIDSLQGRTVGTVVFDPTVVRGFMYYTGVIFEIFDTDPDNARSLMGGGRYDGLVSLFGGEPLAAMGFAIGDVTLLDFLRAHNLLPAVSSAPRLFIGTPSETDIATAHAFADTLRESGLSVLVNVTDKGLGDQIKEAVRRGIPYFIAFGEEERLTSSVTIKNLNESSETVSVPLSGVALELLQSTL